MSNETIIIALIPLTVYTYFYANITSMNEIIILYLLSKGQCSMYGLSKNILKYFGFVTKPGFGALQPALKRFEKQNYLKSDTFFTDGGKACCYYSITDEGMKFLIKKIKEKPSRNPIRFLPMIKVKLICSEVLEQNERREFYKMIGNYIAVLCSEAEKSADIDNDFCRKSIIKSTIEQYKSLTELTERLEHACNGSLG